MRIQYVSSHGLNTDKYYYSSVAHQGDNILIGTPNGLKVFNKMNKEVYLDEEGRNNAVAQFEGETFFTEGTERSVSVLHYSESTKDYLFSFPRQSTFVNRLSASAVYIAVVDYDQCRIKLYNRQSRFVSDTELPMLKLCKNLCFTSDGSLLVTGHDANNEWRLNKYRILPGADKPVFKELWSVKEKAYCCGLAETENGLIFLCGMGNKKIHVYDSEGRNTYFLTVLCMCYDFAIENS